MKQLLLFLFVCAASPLLAQEADEMNIPQWMGPWNSHEFSPDATPYEMTEIPPAVMTSFQNIQVTKSSAFQTECAVAVNPLDSLNIVIAEIDGDRFTSNGIFSSGL